MKDIRYDDNFRPMDTMEEMGYQDSFERGQTEYPYMSDRRECWNAGERPEMGDSHARCTKLIKIQMLNFALIDTNLYLDTHPRDREALEYYDRVRESLKGQVKEYSEKYGPLTSDGVMSKNYWTWINKPWPWEEVC